MQVTPIKRKFGKYALGDVFELRDKTAKALIKLGKLAEAPAVPVKPQTYLTRDMRAAPAPAVETRELETDTAVDETDVPRGTENAPYGYKTDGTPRKRPGRPASGE
jgi:hypothetical protein